ncbi:MAG: SufE family protein [Chlamydiota bacterium]
MTLTFLSKTSSLLSQFSSCSTPEETYEKIIEMGKNLPPFPSEFLIPANKVPGCQSILYIHAFQENHLMYFHAESDALISKGLAALLLHVYNGESAESILKNEPVFLKKIGLEGALSPSRSNGLFSILLQMRKETLPFLIR